MCRPVHKENPSVCPTFRTTPDGNTLPDGLEKWEIMKRLNSSSNPTFQRWSSALSSLVVSQGTQIVLCVLCKMLPPLKCSNTGKLGLSLQ